jgi:ribonuclease P protein component
VLAKPNRVVRADDFRMTMRRGRRVSAAHSVVFVVDQAASGPARFGFVISKAVGGSVVRNRLRRRLRAIAGEAVHNGLTSTDVVVRALPGCASLDWTTLHNEITVAIEKGTSR